MEDWKQKAILAHTQDAYPERLKAVSALLESPVVEELFFVQIVFDAGYQKGLKSSASAVTAG